MHQIQIITTPEQLKEIFAALLGQLPAATLPPEAAELEILARKKALSTDEVEKLYGLNANTLRKRRGNGTGPAFSKDGSNVVYTHESIRKYIDAGRQKTIDQP